MIYHFFLDHRIGGQHVYLKNLAFRFQSKYQPFVITTGKGKMTDRSLLNLRRYWRPLYAVETMINSAMLVLYVLIGRIKRENTVFTVHGGAFLAPLIAARFTGIPVLWVIHETTPDYYKFIKLGRMIIGNSKSRIAVVAKRSREVYGLKSTSFLPASVNESFWSRERVNDFETRSCAWFASVPEREKIFRIVAVANLNPLKGIDILLDALRGVGFPFHLQIVGPRLSTHQDYAKRLEQQAAALLEADKGRRIDFLGWQDEEKVRALLASCDLFVLSSRSEASPIALLEAIAMGCITVAADVGDVSAMLEACPYKWIFPAESVADLRTSLSLAAAALDSQGAITRANWIGDLWRTEQVARATEALYEQLLF